LLCFLLLHAGQPQPREVLASLLWGGGAGGLTTAQSLKGLRQALWHLHLALPPGLRGAVHGEDDWVELRLTPDLTCDAWTFGAAVGALRGRAGQSLSPAEARTLRAAAALYRGDLLGGWMQDWCLSERERLHILLLSALEKLSDHCESCRDWETGLAYAGRILAYDRASESTHRQIMRLHALSGHRTAALRQFALCERALHEELGVKPSRLTLALYDCVREDRPLDAALESDPPAPAEQSAESGPDPLRDLLGDLRGAVRELRALLAAERGMRGDS
jgi:DNA-binding SARP family transcriptional activator